MSSDFGLATLLPRERQIPLGALQGLKVLLSRLVMCATLPQSC